jgi:hypothetical protein
VSKLDQRISKIDEQIAKLEAERDRLNRRRMITCEKCKKRARIGGLVLYDKMHYVKPHGCTEGDYRTHSEYLYDCPQCGHSNRLVDLHNRPRRSHWGAFSQYFAKVEKLYDR